LNGLGTTTLGQHRMTLFDIMAAESREDADEDTGEAPTYAGLTTARTIQRSPLRQSLARSIEELEALILARKKAGLDTTRTLDPLMQSILDRMAADAEDTADEKAATEKVQSRKRILEGGSSSSSSGKKARSPTLTTRGARAWNAAQERMQGRNVGNDFSYDVNEWRT
jgi:hypothetical protein